MFKLCNIFQSFQKVKHCFCLRLFSVSFMESSILTIIYVFSFLLGFKLYKFGLQIIHLIFDHVTFLGSVDIGGFIVDFKSWSILRRIYLTHKLYKSGLYIISYFGHRKCSKEMSQVKLLFTSFSKFC